MVALFMMAKVKMEVRKEMTVEVRMISWVGQSRGAVE